MHLATDEALLLDGTQIFLSVTWGLVLLNERLLRIDQEGAVASSKQQIANLLQLSLVSQSKAVELVQLGEHFLVAAINLLIQDDLGVGH